MNRHKRSCKHCTAGYLMDLHNVRAHVIDLPSPIILRPRVDFLNTSATISSDADMFEGTNSTDRSLAHSIHPCFNAY